MFNTQIELGILHCLGVDVHASKHPLVKSCYWELPRIGEIKINTDGAAKENPGKGGIGCIYRDCNGNVLGTLSKGLGLVSNFMAECEAIIHGVEYLLHLVGLSLGLNRTTRRLWKHSKQTIFLGLWLWLGKMLVET
ncbi:hypothetical protein GIB67_038616 [Kingdonia uniflora]|uniref:RNase H type-1 domain-containing protein n=1 Tax=Kingdonia uniflora TaxID=39325 RepID=A0A7J7NPL5_9MAGN|nr:hypothetical protein GIB67_038616 [Kingdonia uniflora]